jgi:hypothetical protein
LSQAGAQTAAFFRDVIRSGKVWTVRDAGGIPAPRTDLGQRAMPFWSSESRVRRIIVNVPAYEGFEAVVIELDAWRDRWVPGCERDGLLLGINWSGPRATGWDLEAVHVRTRLAAATPERLDTR